MNKLFLLAAFTAISLLSCKKNDPPTPPPAPNTPQTPNNATTTPTVYIAGDSFDLSTRFVPYPVYWKNGKQVHLPHPGYASGSGIAVTDSAVYVSSGGAFNGNNVTYWKNGAAINVTDPTVIYPTETGITVIGSDVYTVGGAYINNFEKYVPILWKNQDNAIKIATHDASPSNATAVAVSGGDVYITGATLEPSSGSAYIAACYWKNGTPTFLHSSRTIYENGLARGLFLSGTDLHVVGTVRSTVYAPDRDIATYWKNGKPTALTDLLVGSVANSVCVDGSNVYIAGGILGSDGFPRAAYWKDGVATMLDSKYSEAKAITVYGGDVYIAGNRGVDTALYWVNSKPFILGRGHANAIAVRK